jgi:hypothetical protein
MKPSFDTNDKDTNEVLFWKVNCSKKVSICK